MEGLLPPPPSLFFRRASSPTMPPSQPQGRTGWWVRVDVDGPPRSSSGSHSKMTREQTQHLPSLPRLKGLFLDTDPWAGLATSPTLAPSWRLRRGPFLHPTRLDIRAALQTFQPRDLSVRSRSVTLPSSFTTSSCSSPCDRPDISGGTLTHRLN